MTQDENKESEILLDADESECTITATESEKGDRGGRPK